MLLGHANPTITQNINIRWRDEAAHRAALDVAVGEAKVVKSAKSGSELLKREFTRATY